jgi:hypothetical protein
MSHDLLSYKEARIEALLQKIKDLELEKAVNTAHGGSKRRVRGSVKERNNAARKDKGKLCRPST